MKRIATFVVLGLLVSGLAYVLGDKTGGFIESQKISSWKEKRELERQIILGKKESINVGQKIPNYFFYDLNGNFVELEKVIRDNKKTIICYLLTECGSCREQMKVLGEMSFDKRISNEIVIISHSNPFELIEVTSAYSIRFPILYDHWNQYGTHLKITEFPFNVVLDSSNTIIDLLPNAILKDEIREVIGII